MAPSSTLPSPEPQPRSAPPWVALVDADDAIGEQVEAALHAAGIALVRARLADFANGQAAATALRARDVVLVVYELGQHQRDHPSWFAAFYDAIAAEETPVLITTLARWLQEEQGLASGTGVGLDGSGTMAQLLRAIQRALTKKQQAIEGRA